MLKFRRRSRNSRRRRGRRTNVASIDAPDLKIRNLLDDPRLSALVGEVDATTPVRPARLDWSRPTETVVRSTGRRRQLLRAA